MLIQMIGRQWVPQIQHAIHTLLLEVLKRGAHPDDRQAVGAPDTSRYIHTLLLEVLKRGAHPDDR